MNETAILHRDVYLCVAEIATKVGMLSIGKKTKASKSVTTSITVIW